MVTNGEYFDFVKAGGYRRKEYWCEDGWAWRSHRNMKWPFFWTAVGPAGSHEYGLRAIYEEIPMQWDWPADVTYYESRAYCLWKSERDGPPKKGPLRVLTEAEHNVIRHQDHNLDAARSNVDADKVMVTSGSDFPKGSTGANLNMAYSSQNPVNFFPPSHTGHFDTVGNAWEWTEDHFNPLKNFEAHHFYTLHLPLIVYVLPSQGLSHTAFPSRALSLFTHFIDPPVALSPFALISFCRSFFPLWSCPFNPIRNFLIDSKGCPPLRSFPS